MEEDEDCGNPVRWHYQALKALYAKASLNEEEIATSIAALNRAMAEFSKQAGALPATVSDQVANKLKGTFESAANAAGDRLVEKFADANAKARDAAALYERAAKSCSWRVAVQALVCIAFGIAAMVAAAWSFLPEAKTLQELRSAQAQLESNIDNLKRKGGEVEVSTCGNVPCFRTEEREHPGAFGDKTKNETYRMIYRAR